MIVFVVTLMLAAFAGQSMAAVNAVVDETWTTWPNTVYYVASLSGPNAPYTDLKVNITAVDEYALYINGKRVDTAAKNDGKWETVEQYDVAGGANVLIAVEVKNKGIGNGNGLMVDIKTGSDWLGSTTMQRRSQYKNNLISLYDVTWYYYAGSEDITKVMGKTDWYNFQKTFFVDAVAKGFKPVILGKMGKTNYTPDPNIEVIAGYSGDLDAGSIANGGLKLRSIEGENLALGKPSEAPQLVDGDLMQGYSYTSDPMGSKKYIDLVKNYRINRVVLYTGGSKPDEFVRTSVRGYSAEISLDNYRYGEVGIIQEVGVTNSDKGGYEWSEIDFPTQIGRYVRYVINAKRVDMPHIGEMMIFGEGYNYQGTYTSPWLDFGSATAMKNIDRITWTGDVPAGTKVTIQTQTIATENGSPSAWSTAHSEKSFAFDSPEPALQVRYKVTLSTENSDRTPTLKTLTFSYSKDDQPLATGTGSIFPTEVPMGVDTSFVYTLSYKLNTGQNLKSFLLSVPNYARVDSLSLNGKTLTAPNDFTSTSTNDSLYVTLTTAATAGSGAKDNLLVFFRTKLMTNIHAFSSGVYNSTMNDGAGPVAVWEDDSLPWDVTTTNIVEDMLASVRAVPKVFNPAKNTGNNYSVIEFSLANAQSRVKIKIFNTAGTLVRELYDQVLSPRDYTGDNDPGRWDGKDDDGDLVPPGIYVYQVIADTDDGDKVKTGTVVVAY